jgi:hypothetical protein
MTPKRILIAMTIVLALTAAACGGDNSGGDSGSGAAVGGDGGKDLAISAPEDGGEVSLPFTLDLAAGVPLGAPETGNDHVHVFYDGDDSEYEVVTTDSFQVTDLSPGEHTITASLRNADHSPAGTDVTIHVTVTGGGEGGDDSGGSGSNKYGNSGTDDSDDDSGDDSGSGGNYGY